LIVITDEPTSLTDAYAFIKIMRLQSNDANIQIIVNMAENQREGLKTYNAIQNACESFLKFTPRLAGTIRRDPKVKDSIRAQSPILLKNTKSMAAADVAALAVKLMAK
jgi:flagellar biosynthesis protein FlhG